MNWDRIKEPPKEHHNSISLDQCAAERIKADTRYRNLVIGPPVQWIFSWNERGVPVPTENRATQVFRQLFIDGSADEVAAETHRLQTGRSILDQVSGEAKSFGKRLGTEDRERLDWARLTGKNRSIDILRARDGRYVGLSDEMLALLADEWPEQSRTDAMQDALSQCITQITPNNRELLRLRYFERRNCTDVAAIMGRKIETVYQALARLHKALGDCIRARLQTEPAS